MTAAWRHFLYKTKLSHKWDFNNEIIRGTTAYTMIGDSLGWPESAWTHWGKGKGMEGQKGEELHTGRSQE